MKPSSPSTPPSGSILVVGGSPNVLRAIGQAYADSNITLRREDSTTRALPFLQRESHSMDLMILNLHDSTDNGAATCKIVRESADIPIIVLATNNTAADRIEALEAGADEYLVKPFSSRELRARTQNLLRRAGVQSPRASSSTIELGPFHIDHRSREVRIDDVAVDLTQREFDLLVYMLERPNTVFRREELLEKVWGYSFGDTSTVTVHVRRLREKVEANPSEPRFVQTVWGVGYKLALPTAED